MSEVGVSITPDQRIMVQIDVREIPPAPAAIARAWLNRDEAMKLADDMQKLARMLPFVRKPAQR